MYPGRATLCMSTKTTTLLAINLVTYGVPRRDAAGRVEARLARGRQTSAGSPLLILATAPGSSDELSLPVALEARDRVGEPRGQHVGLDRKVEDHLVAAGRRLDARVARAHGPRPRRPPCSSMKSYIGCWGSSQSGSSSSSRQQSAIVSWWYGALSLPRGNARPAFTATWRSGYVRPVTMTTSPSPLHLA